MDKLTPDHIKNLAIAQRLEEVRASVQTALGDEYAAVMTEYRPAINKFIRETGLNPIGVASLIGKRIADEGKNPQPFIAACVQFGFDFPNFKP